MLGIFAGAAQAIPPAVVLNGQQLSFDVAPAIDNGRTLVPLRAIFESLGAEVAWDSNTSTVTATRGDTNIRLQIGNTTAFKNGNAVTLDVPGKLIQNRTMVPLRFVGEAMGCSVNWNAASYTVEITSSGTVVATAKGFMKASIIDVGQGDSILIQLSTGENILIDAGEESAPVIAYLRNNNVTRINDVIITHPHSDHIGGMDDIIQDFDIGKVYMPNVTTTTNAFSDMLSTIQAKGLKINVAKAGVNIDINSAFKGVFIAPNASSYDDLNNYSAVLKLTYGNNTFLFTGDAGETSEQEMLASGLNLQADLLKVGHHGSSSSSTFSFLQAVQPKYAIISVGANNDYGHPSNEAISRLQSIGAKIYRTDQQGTIIATSDGTSITMNIAPAAIQAPATIAPTTVVVTPLTNSGQYIGNKNSKKFHLPSCKSLPAENNRVYFSSREEASKAGYSPCSICKP
jgi:competence protein ComEC